MNATLSRDALREAVRMAMRSAKSKLERKRAIGMYFLYILPDGDVKREDVEDALINSWEAREIVFEQAKDRAKQLQAQAVIDVGDSWMLDTTAPEHEALIETLGKDRWLRITNRLGVEASAKAGMGVAREALHVALATPDWNYMLIQTYERRGADRSHVFFLGQPREWDEENPLMEARGRGASIFRDKPLCGS